MIREIKIMRYAERRNLSYWDALNEPNEVVERFFLMWSLDHARDKLKENTN